MSKALETLRLFLFSTQENLSGSHPFISGNGRIQILPHIQKQIHKIQQETPSSYTISIMRKLKVPWKSALLAIYNLYVQINYLFGGQIWCFNWSLQSMCNQSVGNLLDQGSFQNWSLCWTSSLYPSCLLPPNRLLDLEIFEL